MRKKIKKGICYLLVISTVILLSGCSNNKQEDSLTSKLASEMKYFDSSLSDMLNKANGLTLENYKISAEKIEAKNESSSQGSETSNSSGSEKSSSNDQSSSVGGDSSNGGSASSQEDESKESDFQYKMLENSVLTQDRTPKWDELTFDIETLYSNWSIATLDLYKQNVDNQKILSFNTDLDDLTKAIKDKNKEKTLTLLAKLYSYIPTYSSEFSDDQMQTNLYKIKSSVFNAYAIIEQNNNQEAKNQLQLAEESMITMMNNIGSENEKEYNLNKAYILLKDLQNTVDKNDADIFYLKYKNLVEELNILNF